MAGQGRNFRRFVTEDIEAKLRAQDEGAELLSLLCTRQPAYDVRVGGRMPKARRSCTGLPQCFRWWGGFVLVPGRCGDWRWNWGIAGGEKVGILAFSLMNEDSMKRLR